MTRGEILKRLRAMDDAALENALARLVLRCARGAVKDARCADTGCSVAHSLPGWAEQRARAAITPLDGADSGWLK